MIPSLESPHRTDFMWNVHHWQQKKSFVDGRSPAIEPSLVVDKVMVCRINWSINSILPLVTNGFLAQTRVALDRPDSVIIQEMVGHISFAKLPDWNCSGRLKLFCSAFERVLLDFESVLIPPKWPEAPEIYLEMCRPCTALASATSRS